MNADTETKMKKEMAKKVRMACIKAAQKGFQDAAVSGLCMEGAIEAAVGSMQSLDLEKIIVEKTDQGE